MKNSLVISKTEHSCISVYDHYILKNDKLTNYDFSKYNQSILLFTPYKSCTTSLEKTLRLEQPNNDVVITYYPYSNTGTFEKKKLWWDSII